MLALTKAKLIASRPHLVAMQGVYDVSIEAAFEGLGAYDFHYSRGAPQQVALATLLPLADEPDALTFTHDLTKSIEVDRFGLKLRIDKMSRPILRARLRHDSETITVFVAHLKSRASADARLAMTTGVSRPFEGMIALARRAAEAAALRREVVEEATQFPDRPIIVCGDFSDLHVEASTEMTIGDSLRSLVVDRSDLAEHELQRIYGRLHQYAMTSAQAVGDGIGKLLETYPAADESRFTTVEHIFLSRHFFPKPTVVQGPFEQKYVLWHVRPDASDSGMIDVTVRTGRSGTRSFEPAGDAARPRSNHGS